MRIAYTTDVFWPRINGVTVSTHIFLNELSRRGHEVHLWAPEYPKANPPVLPDPRVSRMKSTGLFFSKEDRLATPFQKRRLFAELDALAPDLIHCQTEFSMAWPALAYGRSRAIPVVMSCHTYFEQYIQFYFPYLPVKFAKSLARAVTWLLFRKAAAIITPSESMKSVLQSYGLQCAIHVVPTGIQESEFADVSKAVEKSRSTLFATYPELKGRRLLLAVGRVGQEKNVDFLLDVVEDLQKDLPGTTLLLAGNGPYLEQFQKNIAERGLTDVVRCLGYVARADLKHIYALADVFTFASVTETQGLVTIEAMMCGTPVVAIGKMGTREVMGGDNGGFMVGEDVAEFSARVRQLLTDPGLYESKCREALTYSQGWTASAMATRLEAFYVDILRQRSTTASDPS